MREAIKPHPTSSFVLHEKYVFLHALAPVNAKKRLSESIDWTNEIMNQMKTAVKANYLAITGPDQSVQDCFENEKFERLKALKRKVDSGNVFKHVPAQLT
jgi:hypothetical protein